MSKPSDFMSDIHDERAARIASEIYSCFHPDTGLDVEYDRLHNLLAAEFRADAEKLSKLTCRQCFENLKAELTSLRAENERLLESIRVRPLCEAGGCPHEIDADDLRARLEQAENDNKDLSEAVDGAIKDREYFNAKLEQAEKALESFAETYPCYCAQNYPGVTEYHGHDCQSAVVQEFVAQFMARDKP